MSANSVIGDFDLNLVKLRKPLEFPDGTTQDTAYTGDGSENLAEVLAIGNDALGQDIIGVGDLGLQGAINQPPNNANPANLLDRTTIYTNLGQGIQTFSVFDTTTANEFLVSPNSNDNIYNPIVEAGDIAVVGNAQGGRNFSICPDSATTCGVRFTDTSATIGAGGAGNTASNRCVYSSGGTIEYGQSHQFSNGVAQYSAVGDAGAIIPSAPSIHPTIVPGFELLTYHLTGDAGTSSATMNLAFNITNTTNYAVFPSIYYGYGGSGGTYNAQATASALSQIVINTITSTQFSWILNKTTGNNVNIYLTFLVVYNISGSDYPKAY